jgi:two-component system, NtrC family, sensor kinase
MQKKVMVDSGYKHTILVVDDEAGIVLLCHRLLEKAGFRSIEVTNPQESLSILEKEPVNLLLADIRMPGMDGFQLIERARQLQPDLAVVVMTGFGTVETAIEALNRGANGLILKPFTASELVQSVQRALKENHQKQDVLRLHTLRPLFAITETLFTQTNPARLLELLLETVCGHLRCRNAGLYEKSLNGQSYCLLSKRGNLPVEVSTSSSPSLLSRVDEWGSAVLVNSQGPGEPDLQITLAKMGFVSMMAAPMIIPTEADERRIILLAGRNPEEEVFRESDLEIFAILSRQAAVALENARLHDELRAYIRQVEESQRALIQAEKMAVTGRLTASIAHEINNPLQSVQNCLHLAGRKELSKQDRNSYLELAQNELERLMSIVQRMLDYYRPGALDRKTDDINQIIERMLKLVERQLADNKIDTIVKLSRTLPNVLIVRDQIQQVLLNLILNSLEAMPEGGIITIETTCSDSRVDIFIEDTGPGVPQGQREHLFEPFISTKENGTGLGLAVSYGIIAAHGGRLDLAAGRGSGACFRISLPVERENYDRKS